MDMPGNDTNPQIWDQNGTNWTPNAVLSENMFLSSVPRMIPPGLPRFQSDSSFIEPAVRFSFFNGGHFSQLVNPFSNLDTLNPNFQSGPMRNPDEAFVSVFEESKTGVDLLGTQSDEAEFSGRGKEWEFDGTGDEFSGKGIALKKRKRIEQKTVHNVNNEAEQSADEIRRTGDDNPYLTGKSDVKGPDPPNEEYMHVRARKGQATNNHSLAERIRREKISERMKCLQDLVPGCDKVTGKAVMLDEIINYVQSLQRQVEFLSMKLATVNPRLDFHIEGLLAKDILQTRAGLSASLGFSSDTSMPFPRTLEYEETLHRPISHNVVSQMQASGVWEDELHNVIHNGFNLGARPHSSDLSH